MRISQYISLAGLWSRRETDRLIKERRISINHRVCDHGDVVNPADIVMIDDKTIVQMGKPIYMIFNKPRGITCTAQKTVKNNIIDFINYPKRIFPVGRLDKESDGLIIMTNDGELSNKIRCSENQHEKEYIVTVDKPISDVFIEEMSLGVEILDTKTLPCHVSRISEYEFRIILTQGLNRQIRRMCKVFGYRVERLQRVRIMNLLLDNLEIGEWRYVTGDEMEELKGLLE
jgi:23S rRNA pseudouridine2604 synthase